MDSLEAIINSNSSFFTKTECPIGLTRKFIVATQCGLGDSNIQTQEPATRPGSKVFRWTNPKICTHQNKPQAMVHSYLWVVLKD